MKFLVFLGSARESTPPQPARLGLRVALACKKSLESHPQHIDVELIDPLNYDLSGVFKPHFSYHQKDAPQQLTELAEKISVADAYVMVSPEYNHSMSPALSHLLNHFGASRFSYKPSAIVTYSAGQWGGARAAVNMRTFLGELGCLPVSAMIHVPKAHEVFSDDGEYSELVEDPIAWAHYLKRTFNQLWWWADASKSQRKKCDPRQLAKDFQSSPAERNAPK